MKMFCEFLRKYAIKIISFKKKKKMKLSAKDQQVSYKKWKNICKENFEKKYMKDKKNLKIEITVMIQENIEVLRIAYVI